VGRLAICITPTTETEIEHFRPLRYDDTVLVTTWVADWRRVRSRRAYEFRLAESKELVARASTDWVFLESASGRPSTIPPEMMAAFVPEGQSQPPLPRARFPASPPPPPGTFRLRRRVGWSDIDQAQHVNNAVHLEYLEDCEVQATTAHGWPPSRMAQCGFAIRAERRQIEYRQPALLEDELELSTWTSDVGNSSAVWHHTISRVSDDALVARARAIWTSIDLATGRPVPIPDAFLHDLTPNIAYAMQSEKTRHGARTL
jgi:YbgC/YbaW family acyl-CoA thioester hydrolase